MAKSNKKVIVVSDKDNSNTQMANATRSTYKTSESGSAEGLLFGAVNYKWVAIGIGLLTLGMLCMMGGSMPSPDVWDDSIIYSTRITVIAPILILAGLGVQFYAIFKKA